MSKPGTIGWCDLTVAAELVEPLRDFYAAVVGWQPRGEDQGEHDDYSMLGPDGEPVTGVCHALGGNAYLPPVWLVYFVVEDLEASLAACLERRGQALGGIKGSAEHGRYCLIRDPAGAHCMLYQAGAE